MKETHSHNGLVVRKAKRLSHDASKTARLTAPLIGGGEHCCMIGRTEIEVTSEMSSSLSAEFQQDTRVHIVAYEAGKSLFETMAVPQKEDTADVLWPRLVRLEGTEEPLVVAFRFEDGKTELAAASVALHLLDAPLLRERFTKVTFNLSPQQHLNFRERFGNKRYAAGELFESQSYKVLGQSNYDVIEQSSFTRGFWRTYTQLYTIEKKGIWTCNTGPVAIIAAYDPAKEDVPLGTVKDTLRPLLRPLPQLSVFGTSVHLANQMAHRCDLRGCGTSSQIARALEALPDCQDMPTDGAWSDSVVLVGYSSCGASTANNGTILRFKAKYDYPQQVEDVARFMMKEAFLHRLETIVIGSSFRNHTDTNVAKTILNLLETREFESLFKHVVLTIPDTAACQSFAAANLNAPPPLWQMASHAVKKLGQISVPKTVEDSSLQFLQLHGCEVHRYSASQNFEVSEAP